MTSLLDQLKKEKLEEIESIELLLKQHPLHAIAKIYEETHLDHTHFFKDVLKKRGVIAEIKRKSPNSGILANQQFMVEDQIRAYDRGGAIAFSVVTNSLFGGSIEDLQLISKIAPQRALLRKDLILHPLQLAASRYYGAHAVLFNVKVLGKKCHALFAAAQSKNMDVIFQVKNRQELDFSLDIGAEIIGACNRDEFNGGKTDISISLELISLIPNHVVKIAESGIESVDQAKILYQAGYDALLIGGLLMRASDPQLLLQQMRI